MLRQPPQNSIIPLKSPLSTHHQTTPPSPLSPISASTSETSFRSSSSTYLDLGGICIRDPDWPPRVSRNSIVRVYDSSEDGSDGEEVEMDFGEEVENDDLRPVLRKHVLDVLESGDGGIYDQWAVEADDALSLEELQIHAEGIESQIETRRRPRSRYLERGASEEHEGVEKGLGADDLADILIGEEDAESDIRDGGVEIIDDTELLSVIPVSDNGKRRHRRIETLEDADFTDAMPLIANGRGIGGIETLEDGDVLNGVPPISGGKRGHRRIETLEDIDVTTDIPPLSNGKGGHRNIETLEDIHVHGGIPPRENGKRGHRRIETLEDIDVPTGIPPLSSGKRGHRKIETLEDIDVPIGIPPLSNGKRGHRKIETLEDIDVPTGVPPLSNGTRGHGKIETLEDVDMPTDILLLPPGKRGHDRLETASDATTTRQPIGHKRIETLDDEDLYDSPPALKRIETLPDEPLDTPVLNGVQKMRFDDIMTIPIPPALPSPIDPDDTPRASYNSDIETNTNAATVDTLSDTSPTKSPTQLNNHHAHTESERRSKLSELSKRVTIVTRSLASIQMLTASQAASAQVTLTNTTNTTKAEISHLRTTLDHLARLTLARAHATLDAVNCHTHICPDSK